MGRPPRGRTPAHRRKGLTSEQARAMAEVEAETPARIEGYRRSVAQFQSLSESVIEQVRGSTIRRVEYAVSPDIPEVESWCRDHGDLHELDFGVQFEMNDGFRWSATWVGPPSYFLGLVRGGVLREGSGEPLLGVDVSAWERWRTIVGQRIEAVRCFQEEVDADFMFFMSKEKVYPLVDAELKLSGGQSLYLSVRMYFPDEKPAGRLLDDCVLVTFTREKAVSLGVRAT